MTVVNLKRLDNCVLNSQQISASNGKGNNNPTVLAKNTHSIYNTPCANPLNKHGNTFQGIPRSNASTRPGFIRSLGDEQRGVNNVVKYQGNPIYNPLNKHGNTFQGIPRSNASTRPGFIRSLGDEQRGVNNVVKYQGNPIYNPLNKHGNAFQGFSASIKIETEAGRDVSKRNSIAIGLDDHIFEEKKLFSVTSEAEMQVAPVNLIFGKLIKTQSVQMRLTKESSIEQSVRLHPPHPEMTNIIQESPEVLTHAQHKKLQQIAVKPDGYCFFRCVLLKNTGDIVWANNASAKEVKNQLLKTYKKEIEDSIKEAISELPPSFENEGLNTYFSQSDFPNCIINDSFKPDGCCLWSPIGLCAEIDSYLDYESLSNNDHEQLDIFTDSVYNRLTTNLKISFDPKDTKPHAEIRNYHYTWFGFVE
ncbi:hypothetical protein [Symbiopectobacterium purcellii]|uniref:hypothetical protein n=1 Tax=Symbiopectobacterium purcellii TaxID=2871826 RepID=UPI003F84E582